MSGILYLVRGLPGAGKSTFARSLRGEHYEADMYFMRDGKYQWNGNEIADAHDWCREQTENAMQLNFPVISVSNTFTRDKELKPYLELANTYNYKVFCLIVENRNGTESVHNVPAEVIEKMRARFSIKL